jgi:hypothetical protein
MTPSPRPHGPRPSAGTRPRRARKVVSKATLVARLVALARSEVGTREAGGNNRGVRVEEYQQATWLNPGPWPWCAAFTCWLLREWARDPAVRGRLKLAADADAGRWRCRDARAFGWEPWARSRGLKVLDAGSLARAGDIVVFDFSHIGLIVAKQARVTDPLHTIEGNTNSAGDRDSDAGDGVWEKRRDPSLARSLIRLL